MRCKESSTHRWRSSMRTMPLVRVALSHDLILSCRQDVKEGPLALLDSALGVQTREEPLTPESFRWVLAPLYQGLIPDPRVVLNLTTLSLQDRPLVGWILWGRQRRIPISRSKGGMFPCLADQASRSWRRCRVRYGAVPPTFFRSHNRC